MERETHGQRPRPNYGHPQGWHHTQRASNGRIEGTNNLLQVLRRTAHGFTNPANFEARGLLITWPFAYSWD